MQSCLVPIHFSRKDKHYVITIENCSDMDLYIVHELDHHDWIADDSTAVYGGFVETAVIKAHSTDSEMYHMHTEHDLGGQSWDTIFNWDGHDHRFIAVDPEDVRKITEGKECVPALTSYSITLDDLNRLEWRITFPPDERMQSLAQRSGKTDPRYR